MAASKKLSKLTPLEAIKNIEELRLKKPEKFLFTYAAVWGGGGTGR